MQIKYDKQADAQYIRLKRGKVYRTEPQRGWLLFDYNKKGEVVGIEILNASKNKIGLVTDGENLVHYTTYNLRRNASNNSVKAQFSGEYSNEPSLRPQSITAVSA